MTIIGLGEAGCNIAEMFESQYPVKLIDSNIEGENCFSLDEKNSPEEYEKTIPDMTAFLSDCSDDILFILSGGGNISGSVLKILYQIRHKNINVVYIKPEEQSHGSKFSLQEKLVYKVLQEYTRSGLFKSLILVGNEFVEQICGDIPIKSYYSTINKNIYGILSTFLNEEKRIPEYSSYSEPKEISRILSYGVYDIDSNIEKMYFSIKNVEDKCYYFFINKTALETDGSLLKDIKTIMKKKSLDGVKISYIIHATDSEQNFCYVLARTSIVQE